MTMPAISDAKLQEILHEEDIGEPLQDALETFIGRYLIADSIETYRYRRFCYYRSWAAYSESASWLERFFRRFTRVDHPETSQKAPFYDVVRWFDYQARSSLYNSLAFGSHGAFGFRSPRKYGESRVPIPLDVWGVDMSGVGIDWSNSTVSGGELAFIGVRIVDFEEHEEAVIDDDAPLKPALDATKSVSAVGRPTVKDEISEAYALLCEEGKIDFTLSICQQLPLIQAKIRSLLHRESEDNSGFEYEAVRRVISPSFNAEKERRKASSKL